MNDRVRLRMEMAGFGLLLLACVGGLIVWHENGVRNATTQVIQQMAEQQQKALDAKLAESDKQHQVERDALVAEFNKAKSPDQMAAVLDRVLGLQKPIVVQVPAADTAKATLPDAPSTKLPAPSSDGTLLIPRESVKPLYDAVAQGEVCKTDLAHCQGDLAGWQQKYDVSQQEVKQISKSRKSGRLKWFVIGAAAGAGAVAYALH